MDKELFIYVWRIGIGIGKPASWAVYPQGACELGPYTEHWERKFLCFYWNHVS